MPKFSQEIKSVAEGPSADEVAKVVRFGLSLITFFRTTQSDPTAQRPAVPALPSGITLPDPICRAFLALVPLSRLEAAGLCSLESPPLPSTNHILDALEHRLQTDPRQFWEEPHLGASTFEQAFLAFESYDWLPIEQATIATPTDLEEDVVTALADLLWNLRHLAQNITPPIPAIKNTARSGRSLFDAFGRAKRGKKRKQTEIVVDEANKTTVRCSFRRGANLHSEYDQLKRQVLNLGLPFTISFDDFSEIAQRALSAHGERKEVNS